MKKILIFIAFIAVIMARPADVYAFQAAQLIDPFCFFACDDNSNPSVVNQTTNTVNSNNYNSNVNSANASVTTNTTNISGQTNSYPVTTSPTPVVVNPAPVYVYDYNSGYNSNNYNNTTSQLNVSCYASPTYGDIGELITWRASAYGGNGNYYMTWSGTNGLSGNGNIATIRYSTSGTKNASINVISGNQSISVNCSSTVVINDNSNYNNYNNNYYNNSGYVNYNNPLSVYCSANITFAPAETGVVWTAYASGGNGSYTYNWNGTDIINNLFGNSQNIIYHSPGIKIANVTVYSGGQSITRSCINSVLVGVPNYSSQYNDQYYSQRTYTAPIVKYIKIPAKTTTVVEKTVVAEPTPSTVAKLDIVDSNEMTMASLFSLKNVPWGWVVVLVILVLLGTIIYLVSNRNKI